MENTVKPPVSYWVVSVVLLIWNLIGIAAYVMQSGADLNALARTDPVTARAFAEMPQWAWMVYALGVASGAVGSLVLLLRRRTAVGPRALVDVSGGVGRRLSAGYHRHCGVQHLVGAPGASPWLAAITALLSKPWIP